MNITKLKNPLEGFNNRHEQTKTISELKIRYFEITEIEKKNKNNGK